FLSKASSRLCLVLMFSPSSFSLSVYVTFAPYRACPHSFAVQSALNVFAPIFLLPLSACQHFSFSAFVLSFHKNRILSPSASGLRSEERRVGKDCIFPCFLRRYKNYIFAPCVLFLL